MADFNSSRFQSKRQTYETPEDMFRPLADDAIAKAEGG